MARNGARRVVVSLERLQESGHANELGQKTKTWVKLKDVFADYQPRRGQEFFDNQTGQRYSQAIFSLTFQYFDVKDLTTVDRFSIEGQAYDIRSIFPDHARKTTTRIDATIQDAHA